VTTDRRLRGPRRHFEGNPHTVREWRLWLLDRWLEFARTPEPSAMDAGAAGEQLVARVRLGLAALIFVIPLIDLLRRPSAREVHVGLGVAGAALALALLASALARRRLYRPWIGFTTSVLDVSLVSLALVAFLLIHQPYTAVNSRVVYPIYLLVIASSALRFDSRICAATGLVAVAQYLAIVLVTLATSPLRTDTADALAYGLFDWSDQISRLILLVIATAVSASLVLRMRRLQWLSARDRLTNVINRSVFDDLLATEALRTGHRPATVAVLLADVDRFGAFNAAYGQAAGDRALRLIAAAIQQATRPRGLVARYGGDEFAVLLASPDEDGVRELAEGVRRSVSQTPSHPAGMSVPQPLTVSVGIAVLPRDGREAREVCARAERRLAAARDAGGDRVIDAEPSRGEQVR
jgi:two-component system cell cycle response regulator